jgi:dihydroxyacetone kinase-like predicted kinase
MLNYAQNYGEFLTITIENMSEEHEQHLPWRQSHGYGGEYRAEKAAKPEEKEEPLKDFRPRGGQQRLGPRRDVQRTRRRCLRLGRADHEPGHRGFRESHREMPCEKRLYFTEQFKHRDGGIPGLRRLGEFANPLGVIPSKTIPQGLVSCMQFSPEGAPNDVYEAMKAPSRAWSGSVTYAIKDTDIEGVHITKDYYMAMKDDKGIVSCVKDKFQALYDLVAMIWWATIELLTIIMGRTSRREEGEKITADLQKKYPNLGP